MAGAKTRSTKARRVARAALDALEGKYPVERRPWYCLAFVREVLEHAHNWPPYEFYRRLEAGMTQEQYRRRWAVDAEAACRNLGWDVPLEEMRPGDILFAGNASTPYGHVGIYVGEQVKDGVKAKYVAENTSSRRGHRYGGALALTPLDRWDKVTTVARVP
jgi:hypothetical protein